MQRPARASGSAAAIMLGAILGFRNAAIEWSEPRGCGPSAFVQVYLAFDDNRVPLTMYDLVPDLGSDREVARRAQRYVRRHCTPEALSRLERDIGDFYNECHLGYVVDDAFLPSPSTYGLSSRDGRVIKHNKTLEDVVIEGMLVEHFDDVTSCAVCGGRLILRVRWSLSKDTSCISSLGRTLRDAVSFLGFEHGNVKHVRIQHASS
jgi:hypothetical protein